MARRNREFEVTAGTDLTLVDGQVFADLAWDKVGGVFAAVFYV